MLCNGRGLSLSEVGSSFFPQPQLGVELKSRWAKPKFIFGGSTKEQHILIGICTCTFSPNRTTGTIAKADRSLPRGRLLHDYGNGFVHIVQ